MAKSKFLPYQDADGDGLIDVCDDVVEIEDPKECPPCIPNPNALVPNWRTRKLYEPFFNEKNCKYQIAITAKKYTTTGAPDGATEEEAAAALEEIFVEYEDRVIEALLQVYDKDGSDESINTIKAVIEHTEYWLDIRPKSRLRLLYSVPVDDLDALDAAADEEDEEDDPADITVTYSAQEMASMMMKVRKGLNLYNRYLKVYRAIENGNILKMEDDTPFYLENYGDPGLWGSSTMSRVLEQLDMFLNKHGYNISNIGNPFFNSRDRVTEITFTYTPEYEIKKLVFYTETCGEVPIVFLKKCDELRQESSWKDPTAMAYFVSLREMVNDLTARVPKPWIDFIKEYTYPEVYETDAVIYDETGGSCVMEALSAEGKQLGQDILDEVFSLGDAIAYKFHEQLCKASLGEEVDEKIKLGVVYDPNTEETTSLYGMAQMQAFQALEKDDQPFVALCARILGTRTGLSGGQAVNMLDKIWLDGFHEIKLCGLFDLMLDAINCLFGGLSLEEALASMIQSALQAMSINNFGDLFIGLPPDKQAELDALVKEKLESGDIFKEGSVNQQLSDTIAGDLEWQKPWENDEIPEEEKNASSSTTGMTSEEMQQTSEADRRTLAQQFDIGSEENRNQLSSDIVLEAYVLALLEVYQDNLLELADELNKFPGAQIIAGILALVDCPRPPILNPSVLDFIKDVELPFCRDIDDITWPKLENPFGWIPDIKDILKFLFQAFLFALQQIIIKLIMTLLVKLCELIGDAICKALETVGDIAASLPDLASGRENLSDIVRESLCGEDASDDQIDDAIVDMMGTLGLGGAAFADQEQLLNFASDVSSSTTRRELTEAFLGEMSEDFATVVDNLIEYEYPDYRSAIPNKEALGSFFGGMGNLMPADVRAGMRDFLQQLPENDLVPANPSICATPEQLETFNALRCEILDGRATPEQCSEMLDNLKDQIVEDLDDLTSVLQGGLDAYIENNMPPLVSDPGCDNGLLPYESDEQIQAGTAALGNQLEQLKVDYSTDMLGNGPRESNWGMINMMLSDTMGQPLTAHYRKSFNRQRYVDFYTRNVKASNDKAFPTIKDAVAIGVFNPLMFAYLYPRVYDVQRGAFPTSVASYLRDQMSALAGSITVNPNNEWQSDESWSKTMDELGFDGMFGGNVDLVGIPDLGYNVTMELNVNEEGTIEGVEFTEKGRKATPDITLSYEDNAKGLKSQDLSDFSYGYNIEAYFGDLAEVSGSIVNLPSDNMRIKITDRVNFGANLDNSQLALTVEDLNDQGESMGSATQQPTDPLIMEELKFEFLSVDNTLTGMGAGMFETLENYPEFLDTFQKHQEDTPQSILLKEMIKYENGATVDVSTLQTFVSDVVEKTIGNFFKEVSTVNTGSWAYGAQFDDLTVEDIRYGIRRDDGSFQDYAEVEPPYRNRDMVLGISYDQYLNEEAGTPEKTRIFYLNPGTFGGSYLNPPIYVKPLSNEGWIGMVDVLFPELSPCKPQTTDLIDFGQIQDMIDEIYPNIPEDERLKSDSDCVTELPYNRILERPSKAALHGLITAATRIYASVHFIKALPTFTTFSPKFPDTFSSAFASYIVETMERDFKDVGGPDWLTPMFNDDEFWYAFLEQCVQTYAYRVDEGKVNAPPLVLEALFRLNDYQEEYEYPGKEDLIIAKETNDAGKFQTLKGYRQDKNLEGVRETEEDAKLIMKEIVMEQLNFMSTKFMSNMKRIDLAPEIFSIYYYILDNMTLGANLQLNSAVQVDGSFESEYIDLPTVPYEENEDAEEPYYTSGGELVIKDNTENSDFTVGEEYVGYYHVHIDEEDGSVVYMVGEYHTDDLHDTLQPVANITIVPIGNVDDIGTVDTSGDPSKPFMIEKYVSINGARMTSSEALSQIQSNSNMNANISDVYPGSLKLVEDENGVVIGLEGELGVRYGLKFSIDVEGVQYEMTSVEIDALDLPLRKFTTVSENSKLLACLINNLLEDEKFQLLTRYIVPITKLTSLVAIYNDMGMLPSIGENTVPDGGTYYKFGPGDGEDMSPESRPGASVDVVTDMSTGAVTTKVAEGLEGWASYKDRTPAFGGKFNLVLEWDNWDQVLLRNSKQRIKKIFKSHYNSKDFQLRDFSLSLGFDGPGQIMFKRYRNAMRPSPGKRLLPWWRRRKLRGNPFNANGELCENDD